MLPLVFLIFVNVSMSCIQRPTVPLQVSPTSFVSKDPFVALQMLPIKRRTVGKLGSNATDKERKPPIVI